MQGRRLIPIAFAASLGLSGVGHAGTVPELRGSDATGLAAPDPALPPPEPPPVRKPPLDSDPYAPPGIDLGGIVLHASLASEGIASSNVTEARHHGPAGVGGELKPSLSFESDWARHRWSGSVTGDFTHYAEHPEMATDTVSASTDFRLDIRRDLFADFTAGYGLDTKSGIGTGIPRDEQQGETVQWLDAGAALTRGLGAIQLRGSAAVTRKVYGDTAVAGGGSQDNGDRDYTEPSLRLRASFIDPPLFKPFVEAGWEPRIHAREFDRNGFRRDSQGLSLKAGLAIDDGPIWSGELALVYLRRGYADAALAANHAWGAAGTLTWSPTELTEVALSLGTALTESTTAGFSGGKDWTAHLDLTQSLRDDLDLLAGTGIEFEKSSSGLDTTYDGSLGLLWKLNPSLALTAGYDFTVLHAAVAADSYVEHRLTAGVVLQR